ncbi:MAG: IS701 family transposase [Nitrospira sp.]|nr:IS701 family transposase [Nitrospira sp.]
MADTYNNNVETEPNKQIPTDLEAKTPSVFDPRRWGLTEEVVETLAERVRGIWKRFRSCFRTKTTDTSGYAEVYLEGLLTMPNKRNYANIARRVIDVQEDRQNLQQFMSDSPWSAKKVFEQIQDEISQREELSGGMLTVDESADEKAGENRAGAARQYLGRFGKVDLGQVGVAIGYYKEGIWALIDAELYLPEVWFDSAHAELRRRWHIPGDRVFKTKQTLALEMIRRIKARGFRFEVAGFDCFYGRDSQFRAELDRDGTLYMADIPCDTEVYLEKPVVGIPETPTGKRGRPFSRWQVLNDVKPVEVRHIVSYPDTVLQPIEIRPSERGLLVYECAARRVWTISTLGEVRQEWLFIRQEHDGTFSFSFSNAPADTELCRLARWRCGRYFVERTFQDVKSEAGWDELMARKYRAWMHHAALDALALWFIAETKLDWAKSHPRDPGLEKQLEVEKLPALSFANVRELLQAVLPLKQLSPQEAIGLVVTHLINRSRSTQSRLKAQCRNRDSS